MRRRLSLISLCIVSGLLNHSTLAAKKTPRLPVWISSRSLTNELAAPQPMGMGKIRPPKGYELQRRNTEGANGYAWVGPTYEDGTRPYLMVVELTPSTKEDRKNTDTQLLSSMLQGIERRRTHWTRTATERGVINGQVFVRARWSGRERNSGLGVKGFSYVAKIGSKFIQISSQQPELHQQESLELAEAAALTFIKK